MLFRSQLCWSALEQNKKTGIHFDIFTWFFGKHRLKLSMQCQQATDVFFHVNDDADLSKNDLD